MQKKMIFSGLSIFLLIFTFSCTTKKSIKFRKYKIAANSSIAVIIDCPENIKNVVMSKFMKKRYKVKAFNSSDFYSLSEIFDIRDFKKVSYKSSLKDDISLLSMEKTYDNIYKLHVYNFEVNKAEILSEMRDKWDVRYLILLDLQDWENVSWGRVIDLKSFELIWVENYPTKFMDNLETIVEYFIASMSGA